MSGFAPARMFRAPYRVLANFLLATMLAATQAPAAEPASEAGRRAVALTLSLAAAAARYERAAPAARGAFRTSLGDLAEARRDALLALIAEAPAEALKLAFPAKLAAALPPEARAFLEREGAVEGDFRIVQIDADDPAESRLAYGLLTDLGDPVALHFAGPPPDRLTGERVVAHGLILESAEGTVMALGPAETDLETAFCCSGLAPTAETSGLPGASGAQSTAALLVNFADDPSQPWSVAEIEALIFGEVGDYLHEVSHGKTWLTGDAFGWLTIAAPSDPCELDQFAARVAEAASAAGVDLSLYDRQLIFTPERAECGFAGLATIGGAPSIARFDGVTGLQVVTHEFGHNLGLHHGHSLDCGLETLAGDCAHQEYGDKTDTMGSPDAGHFSAFHKQRLGWLTDAAPGELRSVAASGAHTLDVFETLAGANPKSIRVPAGADSATGAQRWLYLTYRQPVGFDAFYADRSYSTYCRDDVTDGVYAHLATEDAAGSSYLLNMRTNSCWVDFYNKLDWFNPRLAPGESFVIPGTGATITVDSAGPSGATVIVNLDGAPPCVAADPLIEVAPVSGGWGAPGDTLDYAVSVVSADSAECGSRSFALSASAPAGWEAVFSDDALFLAPGAEAAATLNLTSAASAAEGAYDTEVSAASGGDVGTGVATYLVSDAVANQPPVAVDDSAETDPAAQVVVRVLDNDSDPDGDPLSIIVVNQPGNGEVALNPDGTITYTPGKRARGSDSFAYTISDGAAADSASVTVVFVKSGGGAGGGGAGGGKGGGKK